MTLLVAVQVPSKNLNPLRQPIVFSEPCIIISADSRFSFDDGKRQAIDDGAKVFRIGESVIAGYCGDVYLAESALGVASSVAIETHLLKDTKFILTAITRYLQFFAKRFKRQKSQDTTVLVGLRNGSSRFELWELNSRTSFLKKRRMGILIRGKGANKFESDFETELRHHARQWAAPAKINFRIEVNEEGKPQCVPRELTEEVVVNWRHVVNLVSGSIDEFIQKGKEPSVGGWTQTLVLTISDVFPMHGIAMEETPRPMSRDDLSGYLFRDGAHELTVPMINKYGKFMKNSKFTIKPRAK